jgi:hypothetical protein
VARKGRKRINSKRKGKRGELDWRNVLRRHGWTDARRGQQFCGANGDADVVGVPGIHFEVKRAERLDLARAMDQATADAKDCDLPVVAHKRNNAPWLVTMQADDFLALLRAVDDIE